METPYILEKDGEYIVMPTAKAAGEYLRVDPSMISGYCTKDRRCKGCRCQLYDAENEGGI